MAESLSFESGIEVQRGPVGRLLHWACQGFALAGGLILLLLINMSLISIIGRKLFATPIRGDIELMEIGASIAIAAFLPLCELRGTHIKVDTFTMKAPQSVQRGLDAIAHLLCLLAALLLAWRTSLQMLDNMEYGDVSTLLSIPMWIPLSMIVPSLLLLALASAWRLALCLNPGGRP
ncbi:TRAP transporter small permease [Pseudomonas oryzae]|uniref:TRAP transporter small permease protein n=1 Tax=Pseudomonas oryzae TaxID=1392877 RepID=A0A1H1YG00_9PSED|nr:TRAP transporter small permease subunit [Pseudomonas oryzae]SDT20357.1 TRAP-type C4-dicarboxylate transport system, small permease component [Pseudomonas oryzae]